MVRGYWEKCNKQYSLLQLAHIDCSSYRYQSLIFKNVPSHVLLQY